MAWSTVLGAVLTAALVLPAPAGPQRRGKAPAARLETFPGTLEEAHVSAHERNVPLVVIAILEDPADDVVAFRENVLSDRALARASALAVVLLTNNGLHPAEVVRETVDGVEVEREVCSVYRTGSCGAHQKAFDEVYNAFHVDGELILPFVAVLTPDREVQATFADGTAPGLSTVLKAYEAAQRKAGEGLTEKGLREVRAHLARGAERMEKEAFGDAWRASAAVLAITEKTRYADEARARQAAALKGLEGRRDAAIAEMEGGAVADGYRALVATLADAAETPLFEDLERKVKQIERDKRFKEEIAAVKKELAARALLEEAERLFREGEDKKAASKVRQLLRKYEGTEAAAEARERWPELA